MGAKGLPKPPRTQALAKGKATFGVGEATPAKGSRRRQRAPLDHTGSGAKAVATPACPERAEDQNEGDDLAHLVVKYFGDEIREVLAEVTGAIQAEKHTTRRGRRRKGS